MHMLVFLPLYVLVLKYDDSDNAISITSAANATRKDMIEERSVKLNHPTGLGFR